jgi:hypothetical protein
MDKRQQKHEVQDLEFTPQRCPSCGGQRLVLHGAVRKRIEQSLKYGQLVGKRIVRREQQDVVWDRVSCADCGAQCERADERILRLQEEVEKLQFELAFMTGQLVSENRLPC